MNILTLSKNIKHLREEKGWSSYHLYKSAGIGAATMSRIDNGTINDISLSTVDKIAKALDVTIESLFSEDGTIEYTFKDLKEVIKTAIDNNNVVVNGIKITDIQKRQFEIITDSFIKMTNIK